MALSFFYPFKHLRQLAHDSLHVRVDVGQRARLLGHGLVKVSDEVSVEAIFGVDGCQSGAVVGVVEARDCSLFAESAEAKSGDSRRCHRLARCAEPLSVSMLVPATGVGMVTSPAASSVTASTGAGASCVGISGARGGTSSATGPPATGPPATKLSATASSASVNSPATEPEPELELAGSGVCSALGAGSAGMTVPRRLFGSHRRFADGCTKVGEMANFAGQVFEEFAHVSAGLFDDARR